MQLKWFFDVFRKHGEIIQTQPLIQLLKVSCTQAILGRENAARRVFWAKKMPRLAVFGNRKFSNFCRAAKRKWDAQLEIEAI